MGVLFRSSCSCYYDWGSVSSVSCYIQAIYWAVLFYAPMLAKYRVWYKRFHGTVLLIYRGRVTHICASTQGYHGFRMFGAKSLFEPRMVYLLIGPLERNFNKIWNQNIIKSWKGLWKCQLWNIVYFISLSLMTSSNGSIFLVTGPLWGESTGQRPVMWSFDVSNDLRLNKRLKKNNRDAGDLRRHRAHYDINVMP